MSDTEQTEQKGQIDFGWGTQVPQHPLLEAGVSEGVADPLGSFTRTAQNYGYKKTELRKFAQSVLAHPNKYKPITRRRARFYLSVISN